MIRYVELGRWNILKRRLLACATLTTVNYVEVSVVDRYIWHSEKMWIGMFKWGLNRYCKKQGL